MMLFFLLLYMFHFLQNKAYDARPKCDHLIKEVLTLVTVGNVTICNFSFPSCVLHSRISCCLLVPSSSPPSVLAAVWNQAGVPGTSLVSGT